MRAWNVVLSTGLLILTFNALAEPAERIGMLSTQTTAPIMLAKPYSDGLVTKRAPLLDTHQTKHDSSVGWEEGEDVQYAIFRSSGDVYFKGRAGYLTDETKEEFEDISIEEIINTFGANGALGIGAGYTLKNGNKLEFDYTITKRSEQIIQIEYLF